MIGTNIDAVHVTVFHDFFLSRFRIVGMNVLRFPVSIRGLVVITVVGITVNSDHRAEGLELF